MRSGIGVGKRAQHHAVDDAEDRRGAADAEREGDERDQREAGRAHGTSVGRTECPESARPYLQLFLNTAVAR